MKTSQEMPHTTIKWMNNWSRKWVRDILRLSVKNSTRLMKWAQPNSNWTCISAIPFTLLELTKFFKRGLRTSWDWNSDWKEEKSSLKNTMKRQLRSTRDCFNSICRRLARPTVSLKTAMHSSLKKWSSTNNPLAFRKPYQKQKY